VSSPIFIVAKNTYIEMIRDRVLYFVVVFSILFMALCFALGQLSYSEIFRLSVSLGLSGIHLCFAGLTIFLGCVVFYREIESKTIYTLLVRPLTRTQYLIGKYMGLMAILLTMLACFIFCFSLIELFLGVPMMWTTYYPFIGYIFEAAILLAVTFFFSSFSKPFLSSTCSLAFFLIGHWVNNLELLARTSKSETFVKVARVIYSSLPDLETLNWRDYAIAKAPVFPQEVIMATGIASLWALFFFLLAVTIFKGKDFE